MSRPEEEYREFVGSRAASLHRTAYLLCGDWHLASDLVQETFVLAFRHWRRVQRADNQNAYVKRILINEFNRHWRRYGGLPVRADMDRPEAAVPDVSDEVVNRADLLRALLTLPARQRATVVLRYLEGMSERETAAVMRCSEGTVKSQTARALNTLGGCLKHKELPICIPRPNSTWVRRSAPWSQNSRSPRTCRPSSIAPGRPVGATGSPGRHRGRRRRGRGGGG